MNHWDLDPQLRSRNAFKAILGEDLENAGPDIHSWIQSHNQHLSPKGK